MANYVFAYSGGKGVATDEAERNAQYAKWGQWFGELGSPSSTAALRPGAQRPSARAARSAMAARVLTGYSIVTADSSIRRWSSRRAARFSRSAARSTSTQRSRCSDRARRRVGKDLRSRTEPALPVTNQHEHDVAAGWPRRFECGVRKHCNVDQNRKLRLNTDAVNAEPATVAREPLFRLRAPWRFPTMTWSAISRAGWRAVLHHGLFGGRG